MPGAPFGIFEKSSLPSCFCGGSFMQNGQWSVDTTCRSFFGQPLPERVLVPLLAQRRRHHVLRALEAGPLVVLVGEEEVLRAGLGVGGQAHVARLLHLLQRVRAGEVDDVDGHARHLGQRDARGPWPRPRRASGRVSAWYLGAVCALAQRLLHQRVDDAAVLGVHADEPAVLARLEERAEDGGVVHLEHARVGHEELERRDALVARPAGPCRPRPGRSARARSCGTRSRWRPCPRPSSSSLRRRGRGPRRSSGWRSRRWWWCRRGRPRWCRVSKSSAEVVPPNGMSRWVCTSMPPGITSLPEASITVSAGRLRPCADEA